LQLGQYNVPTDIADKIRITANEFNVPQWFAMGIAGAESDWKADACGDTHNYPAVTVGGNTYQAPYCAYRNIYACSWGLLQLNLCGGQGVGYTREQLVDPQINLSIGMPRLADGVRAADNAGASGRHWVYIACINSGHPGWVPETDGRIDTYWEVALKLIFNADGTWAQWPPISGEELPIGPPSPQQLALQTLKCELLGQQQSTGRSLRTVRQLLIDLYGDTSGASLESLRSDLADKT